MLAVRHRRAAAIAGHLRRLGQVHQFQQRRRDVGEPAFRHQRAVARAEQEQRHRIGGVRGMRPAGLGIAHHLAIAVVGGDDQRAAGALDGVGDAPEPGVDRLHRLDRRRQAAGVADHVGIGVVQDDQVVLAGVDRGDDLVGQFRRRHFRLQVVGRDLRRRHHDAVLAGKRLLAAAVEEIRDVRIFLGLGGAQLRAAGVGDDLAEDFRERLRREDRLHELVELVRVLRHADGAGNLHRALAFKARKLRIEHGARGFRARGRRGN